MSCPFCNSNNYIRSIYPLNKFNGKEFRYIKCKDCNLIYLDRFPDQDDYLAMYPPSYQGGKLESTILADPYKKLPGLRFSYGLQFDLIRSFAPANATVLDYGCGTGNFVVNAIDAGFKCDGAEFNEEYVSILKKEFTKSDFFTIDEVLASGFAKQYDVIRLSNVFEHLTNPQEIISILEKRLKPEGVLLVEGPIESNFSLAGSFRNLYFRVSRALRPQRVISGPPYHIFFSDATNQRNFFKAMGFRELHFKTAEAPWPFPASIKDAVGLQQKITAIIAKVSIAFTRMFKQRWGNVFIYAGTYQQ